jgi:hypothetical protein
MKRFISHEYTPSAHFVKGDMPKKTPGCYLRFIRGSKTKSSTILTLNFPD